VASQDSSVDLQAAIEESFQPPLEVEQELEDLVAMGHAELELAGQLAADREAAGEPDLMTVGGYRAGQSPAAASAASTTILMPEAGAEEDEEEEPPSLSQPQQARRSEQRRP